MGIWTHIPTLDIDLLCPISLQIPRFHAQISQYSLESIHTLLSVLASPDSNITFNPPKPFLSVLPSPSIYP